MAKFHSLKYASLILTVDPKIFTVEAGFRVTKGMNGLYPQGLSIEFHNHEYQTDDQRLVKILKRHPSYGVSFISVEDGMDDVAAENSRRAENNRVEASQKAADTDHGKKDDKNKE